MGVEIIFFYSIFLKSGFLRSEQCPAIFLVSVIILNFGVSTVQHLDLLSKSFLGSSMQIPLTREKYYLWAQNF